MDAICKRLNHLAKMTYLLDLSELFIALSDAWHWTDCKLHQLIESVANPFSAWTLCTSNFFADAYPSLSFHTVKSSPNLGFLARWVTRFNCDKGKKSTSLWTAQRLAFSLPCQAWSSSPQILASSSSPKELKLLLSCGISVGERERHWN